MATPTLATLLPDAAARFGDRSRLRFPDGDAPIDFAALDRFAAQAAGGLAARGVKAADHVLLHLPNGIDWVIGYHAIARLGAVVVPVNIMATAAELAFIAKDARVRLAVIAEDKADALAGIDCIVCRPGELTAFGDTPQHDPASVTPEDLFSICYTSGTTGRPKGAMLTHGNVVHSVAGTAMLHMRACDDVALSALPFPHVYGNVVLNAALLTGMDLIAPARFDAGQAIALIAAERVTLFEGVPTMYYQMLGHPALADADLSSLVRCTVGGQTMPVAKMAAVAARLGCPLLELWGMTELAGPATTHAPWWTPRPGSVGLPLPGTQLRIAALDGSGRDVAIGEDGEVMVRGPLVTRGYWNRAEDTAEALDADGWFATGDIGRLDADGYLTIADRKKDMILTGGYNVYPAELEQVLAMHPAVRMSIVVGVPDEAKGEVAHAYVVVDPAAGATPDAIVAHCRVHLSAYKVPRRVLFVTELPQTSTGKLMRGAQRERRTQDQKTKRAA